MLLLCVVGAMVPIARGRPRTVAPTKTEPCDANTGNSSRGAPWAPVYMAYIPWANTVRPYGVGGTPSKAGTMWASSPTIRLSFEERRTQFAPTKSTITQSLADEATKIIILVSFSCEFKIYDFEEAKTKGGLGENFPRIKTKFLLRF